MRLPQYVGYDQDGNRTGYYYSSRSVIAPSGLRIADASTKTVDQLNVEGLYPCVPPTETPAPYAKRITGYTDQLIGDRAQLSYVTDDLTAQEIAEKLAQAKAEAMSAIDRIAASVGESVTDGLPAVRAEEYRITAEEAEALLAETDPDNPQGTYATLDADLAAGTLNPDTGLPVQSLREAAEVIIATRAAWRKQGLVAIRTVRLAAKAAVRTASTIQEVHAAQNAIVWPEF